MTAEEVARLRALRSLPQPRQHLEPGVAVGRLQFELLARALGREPSAVEVGDAIAASLQAAVGRAPLEFEPEPEVVAATDTFRRTYLDDAWTWRR